jgi:hypothetical protein
MLQYSCAVEISIGRPRAAERDLVSFQCQSTHFDQYLPIFVDNCIPEPCAQSIFIIESTTTILHRMKTEIDSCFYSKTMKCPARNRSLTSLLKGNYQDKCLNYVGSMILMFISGHGSTDLARCSNVEGSIEANVQLLDDRTSQSLWVSATSRHARTSYLAMRALSG